MLHEATSLNSLAVNFAFGAVLGPLADRIFGRIALANSLNRPGRWVVSLMIKGLKSGKAQAEQVAQRVSQGWELFKGSLKLGSANSALTFVTDTFTQWIHTGRVQWKTAAQRSIVALAFTAIFIGGTYLFTPKLNMGESYAADTTPVSSVQTKVSNPNPSTVTLDHFNDPYLLLKKNGIPQTLSDSDIALAKAFDLRMQLGAGTESPRLDTTLENSLPNAGENTSQAANDTIRNGSHILKNGTLKPNVKYQTGEYEYIYQTDDKGRLKEFNADDLKLTKRKSRLPHKSNTPGKVSGDHAGHLAGDRFGGSPELDNLVSQSGSVNLSKYKKLENQWAQAINEGKKVSVHVIVNYEGDSLRPKSFEIKYVIDGAVKKRVFNN